MSRKHQPRAIRKPAFTAYRSKVIDIDYRFSKRVRCFLREVVPDAALEEPVRVLAGELLAVRSRIRMWRTIGITFKCDGGHSDDRTRRELLFQIVVLQLAIGQPKPPAVVMDHQGDMVWVVKCLRGPIERRVVKTPLRRCDLPNELRKLVAVFFVARAPAFRREVVLVPPLELRLWRQRHLVCFAAADQIPAH